MSRRPKTLTFHEKGQTLTLHDRGTHVELMIGHVPILSSAVLGTERAFGELARKWPSGRILVGGLGFGSTLAGVLSVVGPAATVLVVEKLATVVKLVKGELAHLSLGPEARGALDDPRVKLVREDVVQVVARERDLDCILLDVDNGPEWASFTSNAALYDEAGLRAASTALRAGGAYAVWSGYPADPFLEHLARAGLTPSVVSFEEKGRVQARAYVGTKRAR